MYNAAPPWPYCHPNQPPAGYPAVNQNHQSSVPPTRTEHAVRYANGPTQQPYPQDPPVSGPARPHHAPSHPSGPPIYQLNPPPYPPSSAPSTVQGASYQDASSPQSAVYPTDTYSINDFLSDTRPVAGTFPFEVDKTRPTILQVNLGFQINAARPSQQVYVKKESMLAWSGEINFQLVGGTEHGIMKKSTAGRPVFVKATSSGGGRSQLHLADSNKTITVLQMNGEFLRVNGDDLLAFEPSLNPRIVMMKELCTDYSGGLFNVQLSGTGWVAITSRGKPLTLPVEQGQPTVYTDFEATVAWLGDVNPDCERLKGIWGHRGGEGIQMKFDPRNGYGYVVVHPYQEIAPHSGPCGKFSRLVGNF